MTYARTNFWCTIAGLAIVFTSLPAIAVTIETVLVGNPGNEPDRRGRGAVAEPFRIGKTEVTNSQYAEFLNAVASSEDIHGLYHDGMGSGRGGITQSGNSGSWTYDVAPDMANKPVIYITFWDAARFANWLHNGQPTGFQNSNTTEDGVYALGGVTFPDNDSVHRNPGARWFLPTEDEWYKAAYHQPAAEGGDVDDYWRFPTGSNRNPTMAMANAVGDIANPGENVANHNRGAVWNGVSGNVTTVGSAGSLSESFYGTSDQAGNVWEWTETITEFWDGSRPGSSLRATRGGGWITGNVSASIRRSPPHGVEFGGAARGQFSDIENRDELWRMLVVMTANKVIDQRRYAEGQKRGGGQVRGDSVFNDGAISGACEGLDQIIGEDPTPDFLAVLADEHQRLMELLDDDTLRQVALCKMEGYKNEEIADRLSITPRSVERKLHRIRLIWSDEV